VRVVLRQWRDEDREPHAAFNADPEVRRYLGGPRSREQSDSSVDWMSGLIEERGWGLWAVEVVGGPPFIGVTGLNQTDVIPSMPGAIEVSWRLGRPYWGQGYATEAAREAVRFGFEELGLDEIVSITVPANLRSRRVMERLGMTHDPYDDFDMADEPPEHTRHVLYRLRRVGCRPCPRPCTSAEAAGLRR
jgi:RimJ/RimL family protein N-acetyltransferase